MIQTVRDIGSLIELLAYALTAVYIICCLLKKKENKAKFAAFITLQCEIIAGRIIYLLTSILALIRGTDDSSRIFWLAIAAATIIISGLIIWMSRDLLHSDTGKKEK